MPLRTCCFVLLLLAVFAVSAGPVAAQGSTVRPGPEHTLLVNGAPFYPLGWTMLGVCPADPDRVAWDAVQEQLAALRRVGANAITETGSANGRFLPRRIDDWPLWKNYEYTNTEGELARRGHPRPGAFVAAMARLMDEAYGGTDGATEQPIYSFVPLPRFVVPEGINPEADGSELLSCEGYTALIEKERRRYTEAGSDLAGGVAPVRCDGAPATLPYWEWTIRYIVQSLRNHPGLLGWYLWDEPEGIAHRHLFGIVAPDTPVPRYTGPESLPTPDFLRYVYDRVVTFEREGRPASAPRHPVLTDLYEPDVFFSRRFAWSRDGSLQPEHHSGPFDRTPDGDYRTPADILGLDASGALLQTAAVGSARRLGWYWDANVPSRKAEMMREAVERDDLWSGIVVAGQGQLSSKAPYALAESVPCPNPKDRLRVLNDRDLVWHLLTLQLNGLRGHLFYARSYLPQTGPGAEQMAHTDRLLAQFRDAEFDRVFMTPRIETGWATASITVNALTNYFRQAPMFAGPIESYDVGRSAFSRRIALTNPSDYRVANFGRYSGDDAFGHATTEPSAPTMHEAHELLRTALHRYEGDLYLFVSNAFDARIAADLSFDAALASGSSPLEADFDLEDGGRFAWAASPERLQILDTPGNRTTLRIELEPYEARVFRMKP
jgi:hypothetical protein